MNWYRRILAQEDMNAVGDTWVDYGHKATILQPGEALPEQHNRDEMWIFQNGSMQRSKASDHLRQSSPGEWTHDQVWGDIDEGRSRNNMGNFWKGRYDGDKNIVTVIGPVSQNMRDIPSIITRRIEETYPGATVKRFM